MQRVLVAAVLLTLLAAAPAAAQDPAIAFWPHPGKSGPAAKIGPASDPAKEHEPGLVLVRLAPGVDAMEELGPDAELVFGRWWKVPGEPGEKANDALWRFAQKSSVEVVELNYILRLPQPEGSGSFGPMSGLGAKLAPNDPGYPLQWHFSKVQAASAWDRSTGNGVVVAVIDSGITRAGEDLTCRTFVHDYNAITQTSGSGAANDDHGHGSHVAGTVAQCTNNGKGVAGLAYSSTLMPIRVCTADGCPSDATARGIDWARSHGAKVINMSLGAPCNGVTWPTCSVAIQNDAIAAAAAADVVIVAAAGNEDQGTVGRPANHPDVIAISATGFNNVITQYSNYGAALTLAAPGGDMAVDLSGDGYPDGVLQETLSGTSPPCFAPNPSGLAYCYYQGTSMASPHVAGAAAILRAHRPSATRQQVKQALIESALDLGAPGKDNLYGYGFLQINSALTRLEEITGGGTAPCVRNAETACLLSNRFEVKVNWQTTTGSGTAKVMSFGGARTESDQSVFYYFFDPANFEMGVKVLNGCGLNNKFWIFVSGLTNQAYTVTVRDTQTGTVKSYSNPLGSYPQTVGDTSALNCSGSSASSEGEVDLQFVPVEVLPDEAPLYTRAGQSADAASGSGARRAPATDPGRPLSPVRLAPEESGPAFSQGPQIMAGKAVTDYGLDILGYWEWSINAGMTNIRADQVTNTRPTTSGPLRLALWATASPITANGFTGYNLGYCDYAPLQGGYHYPSLTCTVPYIPPAAGCYYVSIVLHEYTDGTWYYVDWVATNETFALNGGSCAPPYSDPQILGQVEWSINGGSTYIRANNVKNLGTATSGPLGLSLVATTDPVTGSGTINGSTLGSCSHPALGPGASVPSMICNSAYTPPSPGCYYATVLLLEQVSGTWYYTDLRSSTERYALNGGSCTPTGACVRSANKACLLAGRFEVLVSFQTDNSNGNASVMSFGGQRTESDQSVFYYFFDPANFEMGVKVLDACGINNRFWIFVSGLTNQGFTVTVRDTQTGRTKTYTNPLGTYPITVGDTDALPCT